MLAVPRRSMISSKFVGMMILLLETVIAWLRGGRFTPLRKRRGSDIRRSECYAAQPCVALLLGLHSGVLTLHMNGR